MNIKPGLTIGETRHVPPHSLNTTESHPRTHQYQHIRIPKNRIPNAQPGCCARTFRPALARKTRPPIGQPFRPMAARRRAHYHRRGNLRAAANSKPAAAQFPSRSL